MSSRHWTEGDDDRTGDPDARTASDGPGATAAGLVSAATLAVAFSLLALGVDWFWIAFPVGYGGVLPFVVARAKARASAPGDASTGSAADGRTDSANAADAALADVRERYARGEFDEAEMEARIVDALRNTDGPTDDHGSRPESADDGRTAARPRTTLRDRD
jgi:hypothetical protein